MNNHKRKKRSSLTTDTSGLVLSRRSLLIAGGLSAFGMGFGVWTPSWAENKRTLHIARAESFDGWVPDQAASYATYQTLTAVLEPLLRVDGTTLVPGIAESWEYDHEKSTWTFILRKGVTFSDGSPLTSADVVFSAGIWKSGSNFGSSYLFDKAHAPDPRTVVFDMSQPNTAFPALLASQPSGVFPKDFGGRSRQKYFAKPIGAGAFTVVNWSTTGNIELKRNPNYYLPGRPYLDEIKTEVAAENSAVAQFMAGEVDIVEYMGAQTAPQLGKSLVTLPPSQVEHLSLNTTKAPLDDHELRLAIAHAIDYESIVNGPWHGYGSPAQGILPPNVPGFAPPSIPSYSRNVAAAKQHLANSRHPRPRTFELIHDAGIQVDGLVAQIIQSNLKDIGITVKVRGMETGAFVARIFTLGADMVVWTYGAITPDISDPLGWIRGTSWLFTGADTDELQQAYNAYLAASSSDERASIITSVQDRALRAAAAIPLCDAQVLDGVSASVRGFSPAPWGLYYWDPMQLRH